MVWVPLANFTAIVNETVLSNIINANVANDIRSDGQHHYPGDTPFNKGAEVAKETHTKKDL